MFFCLLLTFFCLWLLWREAKRYIVDKRDIRNFDKGYIFVVCLFTIALAWQPISYWQFERYLNQRAQLISEQQNAKVYCQTLVDSIMQNAFNRAGHANPATKEMWMDYPYCSHLKAFLNNPNQYLHSSRLSKKPYSLAVFVHESMHVRGEYDEQKTECQAIQRNYRSAKIMGLNEIQAQTFAVRYYTEAYPIHPYFTHRCQPNGELDENLYDSTWRFL